MCHVIIPVLLLGLAIFWFMPPALAIPAYIVLALVGGLVCWLIARAQARRPAVGPESLIGAGAEVVSRLNAAAHAQYLVRHQGELWSANSLDRLSPGELVVIRAVEGINLLVEREAGAQGGTNA